MSAARCLRLAYNRGNSCQYFTELLSFTYRDSCGAYKLQHTGARLGGPRYSVWNERITHGAQSTTRATCRLRFNNKEEEEEEERSCKCIDLKKHQWGEAEKRERESKKQAEKQAAWCSSCRGLLKNESKAHWLSPWKTQRASLRALRACQSLVPHTHRCTHSHTHVFHSRAPNMHVDKHTATRRLGGTHTNTYTHCLINFPFTVSDKPCSLWFESQSQLFAHNYLFEFTQWKTKTLQWNPNWINF